MSSSTSAPRDHTPSPTSEYFDLLSPDGAPLHRTKLRSHVHRDGDWHRSVHVWLLSSRHRQLLLQLRAACKDSFPSHWDVSCAGHLSAGETSLPAARAELSEEVGLSEEAGDVDGLQYVTTLRREVISQGGKFVDREFVDVYYGVTGREVEGMRLQEEEVEAVRWMDVGEYVRRLEAGEPGYVPYPDLPVYTREVFDVLRRVIDDLPKQEGESGAGKKLAGGVEEDKEHAGQR